MKQCYLLLMALLMSLSVNAKSSGTCGDGLKWSLSDRGVLTISGKGEMLDYSSNVDHPWDSFNVKRVVMAIVLQQ